jgi:hypothetical protein
LQASQKEDAVLGLTRSVSVKLPVAQSVLYGIIEERLFGRVKTG